MKFGKMQTICGVLAMGMMSGLSATADPVYFTGANPTVGFANCIGTCGTDTADGDVPLPPPLPGADNSQYYFVTTAGMNGTGQSNGVANLTGGQLGETNGSLLVTNFFTADAGATLSFYFDYISSDGSGQYVDYSGAALTNNSSPTPGLGNVLGLIFDAQTQPSGNIVPAQELGPPVTPAIIGTLTPSSVTMTPGTNPTTYGNCPLPPVGGGDWPCGTATTGPSFSPLGDWNGQCFDAGCGTTGWVQATYTFTAQDIINNGGSDQFALAFAVTNVGDENYDSALAFNGIVVNGQDITETPEPGTLALVGGGMMLAAMIRRRTARK